MRRNEALIDLDADAGSVDRVHRSLARKLVATIDERITEEVSGRGVALEIAGIVDCREEMDGRGHVQSRHRGMWVDRKLPRGGHRGDPQDLRDASRLREVRLKDGDVAIIDYAIELEAREVVLARRQRNSPEPPRLPVAGVIVRRKRFFEPADAQVLQ